MDYKTRKIKAKQTNAELQNRIDHCMTLLAKGLKRAQILADPTVLSWDMTNSSIDKYIQHAKNDIVGNSQQARSEHLGRAVLNLDYIYKKALEIGDVPAMRLCLDCQKEKDRLLKLSDVYKPGQDKDSEDIMPADVRKMIDTVRVVKPPVREDYLDEEIGKNLIVGSSK